MLVDRPKVRPICHGERMLYSEPLKCFVCHCGHGKPLSEYLSERSKYHAEDMLWQAKIEAVRSYIKGEPVPDWARERLTLDTINILCKAEGEPCPVAGCTATHDEHRANILARAEVRYSHYDPATGRETPISGLGYGVCDVRGCPVSPRPHGRWPGRCPEVEPPETFAGINRAASGEYWRATGPPIPAEQLEDRMQAAIDQAAEARREEAPEVRGRAMEISYTYYDQAQQRETPRPAVADAAAELEQSLAHDRTMQALRTAGERPMPGPIIMSTPFRPGRNLIRDMLLTGSGYMQASFSDEPADLDHQIRLATAEGELREDLERRAWARAKQDDFNETADRAQMREWRALYAFGAPPVPPDEDDPE